MTGGYFFQKIKRHWRPILALTVVETAGSLILYKWYSDSRKSKELHASPAEKHAALQWQPPNRSTLMQRLSSHSDPENQLDVLIIGGGATGAGCAVDAAYRGLKVACVEREDWSSGTSSKSTKLVHGGVRYLEKAIKEFDLEQYKLVDEALRERSTFLKIAPHLTDQLPIMLPIYKWYLIPYFWIGSKAYDIVAGGAGLQGSYFLSRAKALKIFPMLKSDGLSGAMVYYDGIQNDSRMNVSLALTAMFHGAIVTNYTKVVDLIKDENGQVKGAVIEDTLTGTKHSIRSKVVINATGPFCDAIRLMDDQKCTPMVSPSAGTHIVLPNYFSPRNMGLIDPSTSDGRVLFFLPWEGNVISGTTDAPTQLSYNPKATENDIEFILKEIDGYLTPEVTVRRSDVLAAWAGIRPLVKDPNVSGNKTEALVRNHLITTSPSGLVTIAGGKWTTYRNMAKETIDHVIKTGLPEHENALNKDTSQCLLIGAHGYSDTTYLKLIQQFGIETDVAQHLAKSYGDRSVLVSELCSDTNMRWPLHGKRLHHLYPYDEAEVIYACRHEHAQTAVDVLARRTRLAFLSVQAAKEALPRVIEIMGKELNWTEKECLKQRKDTEIFLDSMGLHEVLPNRAQFTKEELNELRNSFSTATQPHKNQEGKIEASSMKLTARQAGDLMKTFMPQMREDEIKKIIQRVDPDCSDSLNFTDFLEAVALAKYNQSKSNGNGNSNNLQHTNKQSTA